VKLGKTAKGSFSRFLAKAREQAGIQAARFEDDTPEKQEARIKRAKADPLFFCQTYLGHYFSGPSAAFHGDWLELLVEYARPDGELPRGVDNICPRGFAKTTVAGFGGGLRLLVVDEVPFFCLTFDILAQAEEVVEAIADELEFNPKLQADFGPLLKSRKASKWGANVETVGGCRVQALGMDSSYRGLKHGPHRPWLFIVDDPESDADVRNPKTREKTRSLITGAMRKALEPGGTIWVNQNVIHEDCFSAHVRSDVRKAAAAEKAGLPTTQYRFKHWVVFEYSALDEEGESTWPERFLTTYLLAMREEDPDGFDREMLGKAVAGKAKPFRPDLARFYKPEDIAGRPLWHILILDPSLGRTDSSDYSGIIDLGFDDEHGLCNVIEADLQRRDPMTMIDDLFEHWLRIRPAVTLIESVAFQAILKPIFEAKAAEVGLWPLVEEWRDSTPKELRIKRLQRPYSQGVIRFLPSQQLLLEQLFEFPFGDHDDGPDALEMGWSYRQERTAVALRAGDVLTAPRRMRFGEAKVRFAGGAW